MTQMSFSEAEYVGKRKQTRRAIFLAEMEQVVPWSVHQSSRHTQNHPSCALGAKRGSIFSNRSSIYARITLV